MDNGAAGRGTTDDSTVVGVAAGDVRASGKVADGRAACDSARNGRMHGEGPRGEQ